MLRLDRLRKPFGAVYVTNSAESGVETKRDYKKAAIDACIVSTITAISVLMALGFPPEPKAIYATFLAFVLAFFTSLGKRFDLVVEE